MAVTAWKNPASAVNAAGGDIIWFTPENAVASDDSDAQTLIGGFGNESTDNLRCTNYFSAADIPAGATIDGIEVQIERASQFITLVSDLKVSLFSGGVDVGDNKASATTWLSTDAFQVYPVSGGSTDKWGWLPTRALLIDSGFGVQLQAKSSHTSAHNVYVDVIQCRVYYTEVPTGSSIKVWNGSSWVLKPLKRWDGSAWVDAKLKRWNGSSWVSV
jgi:hypothetical protein